MGLLSIQTFDEHMNDKIIPFSPFNSRITQFLSKLSINSSQITYMAIISFSSILVKWRGKKRGIHSHSFSHMTSIYSTYFSQFEFNNQNIIHQNSLQTDPQNPVPFSSMNSSFVQSVKLVTPYFSHYASDYPVLVQRIPESPVTRFWNSMSGPTISTYPRSRKVCLLL